MASFLYQSRFPLGSIPFDAPTPLKTLYIDIIRSMDISTTERNVDKEDWIESVIPLIELYKQKDVHTILVLDISNNNFKQFLSKEKEYSKEFISVGLYLKKNFTKEIKVDGLTISVVFPREPDYVEYEGYMYPMLQSFKENSNRVIYGLFSTYDEEGVSYAKKKMDDLTKAGYKNEYSEHTKIISEEKAKEARAFSAAKNYYELGLKCKENSIEDKLSELSYAQDEDIKDYFIKTVKKNWALKISIKKNSSRSDVYNEFVNIFEYAWCETLRNSIDTILLQDYADITYEYRFIVLNSVLVCGAGCIEEFTPVDNIGGKFDTQLKEYRYDKQILVDVEKVEELKSFAETIVEKITLEDDFFQNYSLDIGIINGRPGIIEINPYANVGMYALDYSNVLRHLTKGE